MAEESSPGLSASGVATVMPSCVDAVVYTELRRLAYSYLAARAGPTLQATALVNEAYIKLVESEARNIQNRTHFFALAARVMRQILIDYARSKAAQKRGGGAEKLP